MNLQVYQLTAPHPITLWITSNQNSFYWVFIIFSKLNHLFHIFHSDPASQFFEAFQSYVSVHLYFLNSQANTQTQIPKPDLKKSCWKLIFETNCSLLKRIFNLSLWCYLSGYKSTLIFMLWCSLKRDMWVWFILLFSFPTKNFHYLIEFH